VGNNTAKNHQPQGLAVGGTYCYSFEINTWQTPGYSTIDSYHDLYRIHKTNKSLDLMTNVHPVTKAPLTGSNKVALKHANDVALAAFNNRLFMYVVTFTSSEIVKLEYDATGNYWQVARYTYTPVASAIGGINFNGISLIGNTNNNEVAFLLQAYNTFYRVKIGFNDPSGTINPPAPIGPPVLFANLPKMVLQEAFTIPLPSGYGRQTFHYTPSQNKIHVIYAGTNGNTNVVRAYSGIAANSPQLVSSWAVNGSNKFELEGGGLYSGTYWFSTFEGHHLHTGAKNGGLFTDSRIN